MLKQIKKIVAIVIILFQYQICFGQNKFTVENGLPSNWVSCFQMDDYGYLWIGTQNGLSRFDGKNFKNYYNQSFDTNSLASNWVQAIKKDDTGKLWLRMIGGGIQRFNPTTYEFFSDFDFDGQQPLIIRDILFANNKMWVSSEKGLFVAEKPYKKFTYIYDKSFRKLIDLNNNKMLLSSKKGLFLLDKETKNVKKLNIDYFQSVTPINDHEFVVIKEHELHKYKLKGSSIFKVSSSKLIINTNNSTLWGSAKIFSSSEGLLISRENGIWRFDEQTQQLSPYMLFNKDSKDNVVLEYYETEKGDLWIGTKNGMYTLNSYHKTYQRADNGWQHIKKKLVRELQLDNDKLWLASPNGLEFYDAKGESETIIKGNITAFVKTKDNLLFAAGRNTNKKLVFWYLNLETGVRKSYALKKFGIEGNIWKIIPDNDKVWLGGLHSFGYYDFKKNKFHFFSKLGSLQLNSLVITDLLLDDKKLWIATLDGLLLSRNYDFNTIQQYKKNRKTGLTNNLILDLHKDKNNLWLATEGGLHLFNENDSTFKHWGNNEGLLDSKILTVVSDNQNMLWLGTISKGLFKFNPKTEVFTNFNKKLGLSSDEFLMSSSYSKGNQIFFGTEKQIITFNSSKLRLPTKDTLALILAHLSVSKGSENKKLSIVDNQNFELPYNYGNLSFSFNNVNYHNPESTKYSYKITGLYDAWISLGNTPSFSLANLPSGNYKLSFKAENPLYETAMQSFNFIVKRPFYTTMWAYMVYTLLIVSTLFYYWKYQKNRLFVKNKLDNLEEVNRLKSKMYSEISHELKTPLTIIKGNTSLLSNKVLSKEHTKAISTIQLSATEMLNLVNQMLDLTAIDSNSFELNIVTCDLVVFLKQSIQLFEAKATTQNKSILFNTSIDSLVIKIDEHSLKKVIFNLISNAIKFTPKGGEIILGLDISRNEIAKITVSDTGMGIAPEHLSRIFDRYYRTFDLDNNLGTGIGMALVKELIQIMGCSVTVKSELNKGTTFTINLPIQLIEKESIEKVENESLTAQQLVSKSPEKSNNKFQLVVVEDNVKLREYYKQLLDDKYEVLYFQNGAEALKHLKGNTCDFILSDAVMPIMDGYQLCKALKSDWITSHIPFIMVSVLSKVEHKEKGYEIGIDAFLVKPFEEQELLAVINNLLEKQKQNAIYYRKYFALEKETTSLLSPKDLEFIEKFHNLLLDNDKNITVQNLSEELALSRSQLHRKVKTLTNMSTTSYINHIKIEEAQKMLVNSSLNINEIAYKIGYSDSGYFNKVFKKITKSTPKTWRKNHKKPASDR